jgi:hypothetical protein
MYYTEEQIRKMEYWKKSELARNPNTPVGVLEILFKDEEEDIRGRVALNTNTPPGELEILSKDEWFVVVRSVAANPNTPVRVLETLSQDGDSDIRWAVAFNTNSTNKVLVRLFEYERSHEKNSDVFEEIIGNANCPDYLKAVIQTKLEEMK